MLTEYIQAAMRYAKIEWNKEDGLYIGTILPCPGVIGTGKTIEACQADTQESLGGWILLGVRFGGELPVIVQ
jgi:predicted RNase H-like HicB family nuclease